MERVRPSGASPLQCMHSRRRAQMHSNPAPEPLHTRPRTLSKLADSCRFSCCRRRSSVCGGRSGGVAVLARAASALARSAQALWRPGERPAGARCPPARLTSSPSQSLPPSRAVLAPELPGAMVNARSHAPRWVSG